MVGVGPRYAEPEIALATGLASRAALAVDNAILFAREREARATAEEAVARLRDLEVISRGRLHPPRPRPPAADLLDGIRKVMRADTAVALLLDETGEELVASWARGLEEEVEAGVRIPVGKGFAGRVAATRTPVFIPDVERAELVNPLLTKRGLKSLLGVPLLVEGRLLGVLHVGSVTPRVFTNDDERTLQLLADRVALAIEQSRLYESERAASRRLEFLAEASELLGSTLDYTTALQRLSALAVPYLGDWCIVDMLPRRSAPAGGGRPCRPGGAGRRPRVPGALSARPRLAARPRAVIATGRGGADPRGHRRAPAAGERRRRVSRGAARDRDDLADVARR